jgi:hypothetical protein
MGTQSVLHPAHHWAMVLEVLSVPSNPLLALFSESWSGRPTKELVARVPAVYLTSAEEAILAFLPFNEINKLRALRVVSGFESHPHRQTSEK